VGYKIPEGITQIAQASRVSINIAIHEAASFFK
jgi:hypothetical protein